jgi:hypothetical protein
MNWATDMPASARVSAMSEAPVKSSAITPIFMVNRPVLARGTGLF